MLLCDTQLEARASGNIQVLQDLYRALYADWKRMVDEAEQLEQRHAEGLPDATFARIEQMICFYCFAISLLLILSKLAKSAPLPDNACPTCPCWPQSAILGARSVPPFAPGSDILRAIFKIHFDEYNRLMAEARRAGFYKLHLLSGADQDRVYAIMAQARQAQERMYQVMEEMDRVPPP
ncbi:hypothetical protein CF328_g5555 [Tilletia controversa]|nr:hypothetical protein CF328_g5555 [Tilletia controversa]